MKKENSTFEPIPYSCGELPEETVARIKRSVREKLSNESEEIIMKTKSTRKIKPIILAAAIAAMSAISVLSVNAATDGEVVKKIRMFINGKETEQEVNVTENEDGTVTYSYQLDDGHTDVMITDGNEGDIRSSKVEVYSDGEGDEDLTLEINIDDETGEILISEDDIESEAE